MIGDDACPYNSLYWDFMDRNEVRFAKNPRMSLTMRSWAARNPDDKVAIRARAATIRERLRAGESL